MKLIIRKTSALLLSFLIAITTLYAIIPGSFLNEFAFEIAEFLHIIIPDGKTGQNINITYENTNPFFHYSFLAIGFTISLSILLFFWKKEIDAWKIKLITILFLILLMVMSLVNYSYHDRLWRIELQVILDYINVFLGLVVLLQLWKLSFENEFMKVIFWFIYFIICLFGILLPFFFGTIYLLCLFGISLSGLNDKFVTTPATIISLIISWLSYKQKEPAKNASH